MMEQIRANAIATIRNKGLVVLGAEDDYSSLSVNLLVANRHPLPGEGEGEDLATLANRLGMEEIPPALVLSMGRFDMNGKYTIELLGGNE